jgi:hypothetical protein
MKLEARLRKTIPIQPDGSVRIAKELVEEVFGKAREAVVHIRSGCLVLSPVYIDIESGQLPQILSRLHRFEALDSVMEGHFKRSDAQVVQFEGDLSVLSLNDVFLFLSASKKSGALLVQDRARWGFFFRNGNLVFAASDEPRASLAAFLLKRQFLTEQDLVQATHALSRTDDALGALFEATGLTLDEFREQWTSCVEDSIFYVFTMGRGRFSFINGELLSPFLLTLPMSTTNYVMEATRRIDEWARIQDRVPPADAVLGLAEDVTASTALTFEEEQVLSQINGSRTLDEVVLSAKVGEMEGKKAVASLVAAGMVRVARQAEMPGESLPVSAAELPAAERTALASRIESYNNVFSTIYQALTVEVGNKVEVILGAFFKGLEPKASLLSGLGFSQEGTLPADVLLSRLAAISDGREETLVMELNELLYFQLFAVKNSLGPEMEAGIVEMARTLLKE